MRERGNIWPVITVALGAFLVLFVLPLIIHRQKSGEMATVEAHVSIGDTENGRPSQAASVNYRWPNSEVPRTAERLRDLSAVLPREWLTSQSGVLQMPNGTVHLRYSPASLSVELISVPKNRADGPGLLIRLPDSENTTIGARYFESMQLDGILYPKPFAPLPEVISAGWQQRHFKQTQLPDSEREQLEQWSKNATRR